MSCANLKLIRRPFYFVCHLVPGSWILLLSTPKINLKIVTYVTPLIIWFFFALLNHMVAVVMKENQEAEMHSNHWAGRRVTPCSFGRVSAQRLATRVGRPDGSLNLWFKYFLQSHRLHEWWSINWINGFFIIYKTLHRDRNEYTSKVGEKA